MSAVAVRMPEREDEPEWLRLRRALWPECAADQHELDMGMLLADADRTAVFVVPAAHGGRLAGFAEVELRPWLEEVRGCPVALVEALYVAPEERGRGVGQALLEAVEAWARERGARAVAADAHVENEHGRALHRRLGYEEVATRVRLHKAMTPADDDGEAG